MGPAVTAEAELAQGSGEGLGSALSRPAGVWHGGEGAQTAGSPGSGGKAAGRAQGPNDLVGFAAGTRLIQHTQDLMETEEKLCIKVLRTLQQMLMKRNKYGERVSLCPAARSLQLPPPGLSSCLMRGAVPVRKPLWAPGLKSLAGRERDSTAPGLEGQLHHTLSCPSHGTGRVLCSWWVAGAGLGHCYASVQLPPLQRRLQP